MTPQNLYTVKQFVEAYPCFTEGGIRAQIFREEENGLKTSRAIIRIGRKILINVHRYFDWIDSLQANKKSGDNHVGK